MKLLRRILMCSLALSATLSSYAELEAGKTYTIQNVSSGLFLSTGEKFENNAIIYLMQEREGNVGHKWQVIKTGANENRYIIICDYNHNLALDAAPSAGFMPVLWTAGEDKTEQNVLIEPVPGKEDTYQISWAFTPTYKMGLVYQMNVQFAPFHEEAATWFKFTETTPSPVPEREKWTDETVFGENKLPAHATFMPYSSTEALRADKERYARPWVEPKGADYMTLNGTWALNFVSDPADRPGESDFYGDAVDVSDWPTIKVPSCLEMEGYGDPYYINVGYPFHDNFPNINMLSGLYNNVGSYRRDFVLPEGWKDDKRVVLHFDGAYSGLSVWVNGQYVGYSEGANTDAEFDLTDKVREGNNNISVQVIRFTDASYLEGQDMWHMSGIHRDVYLYATPRAYISDHFVSARLDESTYQNGEAEVVVTLANPSLKSAKKKITARLLSPEGLVKDLQETTFFLSDGEETAEQTIKFEGLNDLQPWSSESPTLYTLELSQIDENGKEEMAFATKVGFRNVKISNGRIYVNGERVFFKGVNTQDTHPVTGRTIDTESLLRDVVMMKQANINTIRGSHYPRQPKMYAMFDHFGLYCMDEADIECHYNWEAGGNAISRASSWKATYVDRIDRMVLRDRNYPSVVFWSLGNESGTGANFQAAYDRAKELDPERIVHYEGATRGGASYTDLFSVMYPNLTNVEGNSYYNYQQQPYFMCEYVHAMGNAVGNLKEYWDIIENSTYGAGGCVWDFVDQSIYHADDIRNGTTELNGIPKYMTGSDYPGPHQGNFVNNGLVSADRAWSPELAEVKQVYQYVKFEDYNADTQQLTLRNAYNFTNLSDFILYYELLEDGHVVEAGTSEIPDCTPGKTVVLTLPYTTKVEGGKEYFVTAQLRLKKDTEWAKAEYPIAAWQGTIQSREDVLPTIKPEASVPALTITKEGNNSGDITIENKNISLTVNEKTGMVKAWSYGTNSLIEKEDHAFQPSTYRWVENDRAAGENAYEDTGITSTKLTDAPKVETDGSVSFTLSHTGTKMDVQYNYRLYPSGVVDLGIAYDVTDDNLRRVGTMISLPENLEKLTYYGRGPWDNFIDRREASFFGRYTQTVTDMLEPTPRPQTSGNRTDMRELILLNESEAFGLKFESQGQMDFQVLHLTDTEMPYVTHRWELAPGRVNLHLDYTQKGLGNGSCGGVATLPQYNCQKGHFENMVRITPLSEISDGIGCIKHETDGHALDVNVENDVIVCKGQLAAGTIMTVYDLGGSIVARTTTDTAATSLNVPMKGNPRGTYLVKIGDLTYKVNH